MAATSKIPVGVIAPVKSKCAEVIKATGSRVTHVWGGGPNPDHVNKRCIDLMIRNIGDGQVVANYVWANRARLGVRLIIWNRRIIRTYSKPGIPAGTWARYTGPVPHLDHPHVEFDASSYQAPVGVAVGVGAGGGGGTAYGKIKINSRWYADLQTVASRWVNREVAAFADGNRGAKPKVTREVFYVQTWLKRVGIDPGALDGIWDAKTQAAFDRFRRDRMRLSGSDAGGAVGPGSLGHLRTAARSPKKVT